MSPVKNKQTFTISVNVASSSDVCGGSVAWDGSAWTGSTFGGTDQSSKFRLLRTETNPSTGEHYSNLTTAIGCAISGQKWRDHDNDGVRDTGFERGIGGWTIKAFEETTLKGSAVTATDGTYTIGGLEGGKTYTVCEFAPAEASGFAYRGWIQSVPGPTTSCSFTGAEPNGHAVTLGTTDATGIDFFNVRTITVNCSTLPPDGVFTVGDGVTDPVGTVTFQDACKGGEYVFETWVSGDDQNVVFHPTVTGGGKVPLIQNLEWVIDGDRTQQTLYYDDFAPFLDTELREMLFCVVNADGSYAFPPPVSPDTEPHTSCLLDTTEEATATGVHRFDTVYTLVDGKNTIR